MSLKIAVVALTEGTQMINLSANINKNASIHKSINQHRNNAADIILFHEGNISVWINIT